MGWQTLSLLEPLLHPFWIEADRALANPGKRYFSPADKIV
jgi:hypothetical protein